MSANSRQASRRDKCPHDRRSTPWEVVTIDFICGFAPVKESTHTAVVVVTDKFTRQNPPPQLPPQPTASETVKFFLEMVVARHGLLRLIISDRGSQFESLL